MSETLCTKKLSEMNYQSSIRSQFLVHLLHDLFDLNVESAMLFTMHVCVTIFIIDSRQPLFYLSFTHYCRPINPAQLLTNLNSCNSFCTQQSNYSMHFLTGGSNDFRNHRCLLSLTVKWLLNQHNGFCGFINNQYMTLRLCNFVSNLYISKRPF